MMGHTPSPRQPLWLEANWDLEPRTPRPWQVLPTGLGTPCPVGPAPASPVGGKGWLWPGTESHVHLRLKTETRNCALTPHLVTVSS